MCIKDYAEIIIIKQINFCIIFHTQACDSNTNSYMFRVLVLYSLQMQLNQRNNIKHAPFRSYIFIALFTLSVWNVYKKFCVAVFIFMYLNWEYFCTIWHFWALISYWPINIRVNLMKWNLFEALINNFFSIDEMSNV